MGKIILGTSMSLDGFISDRNGSLERLNPDPEKFLAGEMLQEEINNTGAVVMGRRAYELGGGDYTGYEFQTPIFVLTHTVPTNVAKGENEHLKFYFVQDGIESAVQQAKAAAGDKDVLIIGSADTAQQYIRARLFDELRIGIIPVLLGEGLRFFESTGPDPIQLEIVKIFELPNRTDLCYRLVK